MRHSVSVILGGRCAVPVPARRALCTAIDRQLHRPAAGPAAGEASRAFGALALGTALSLAGLAPVHALHAATITVDTTVDAPAADGACSLPEAVENANLNAGASNADCAAGEAGLDNIVFHGDLANTTITLAATLLVEDELAIDGAGATDLAVSGAGLVGILQADAPLSVSNLALVDGSAGQGGAIAAGDTLTVSNVDFVGNSADAIGGAIHAAAGLTVADSLFEDNEASMGGAIFAGIPAAFSQPPIGKGAVAAAQAVSISNSELRANRAVDGGPFSGGGALAFMPPQSTSGLQHTLGISGSTFTGNEVAGSANAKLPGFTPDDLTAGGAVLVGGPATSSIPVAAAKGVSAGRDTTSVDIQDSEFLDNRAGSGGGVALQASSVTIQDSLLAGNLAAFGGGGGAAISGESYFDQTAGATVYLPSNAQVVDSVFANNGAAFGGGGLSASVDVFYASGLAATGNVVGKYAGQGAGKGTAYPPVPGIACGETYASGKYDGGGAQIFAAESLVITGNSAFTENCAGGMGGAEIRIGTDGSAAPATATIDASTLFDANQAVDGSAGGVGLYASGAQTTLAFHGTVTGNTAFEGGGGIVVDAFDSAVTISGATISGNSAGLSGGGMLIHNSNASVRTQQTTISDNEAASGGGVDVAQVVVSRKGAGAASHFENVTIHGNRAVASQATKGVSATSGGGVAIRDGQAVSFDFATITGNSAATDGGGLWVAATATATLSNSVAADNTADVSGPDIAGAVGADFTLVEDASGATVTGSGNAIGVDPLLGPLADNGGPTHTQLPLPGSPLIDSGDPAFAPPPPTDQRGPGFPRENGVVDKGAVETPVEILSLTITPDAFAETAGAVLAVTQDAVSGGDVLVTIDFTGTALLATDFTAVDAEPGVAGIQLAIAAGSTSGSIALAGVADGIDEPDETLTATVGAASGADFSGVIQDSATLLDADPTPAISIGDATVGEGSVAAFQVTLSGPSSQPVSAAFATGDGTATAGQDYTAASGTVDFAPGETTQTINVTTLDDALVETSESFTVDLSSPANAVLDDAQGAGSITDTDTGPMVTLSMGQSSILEEGGSTTIIATLSALAQQEVTVTLGFSGTATQGGDYTVSGTQIVIPAGQTSGSVLLTTLDDALEEGNETVVVDIASVGNGTESGAQQGTIIIDDSADGASSVPPGVPQPAIIPTLSEWMLMLLGLLLPATVVARLHRRQKPRT